MRNFEPLHRSNKRDNTAARKAQLEDQHQPKRQERRTMRRYWTEQSIQIKRKQPNSLPTSSEPPLKNAGSKKSLKTPRTEQIPRDFSERPMCWTTHIEKQKIPLMRRCRPIQKAAINLWDEQPPCQPTPRRVLLTNSR